MNGNEDLTLDGTPGNDTLVGLGGNDTLDGGDGDDLMFGQSGDDLLKGGSDQDVLSGGAGLDLLDGGRQSDSLFGGAGADQLLGGGGSDILVGGAGADVLTGGGGKDKFVLVTGDGGADAGSADRITDFQLGKDKLGLAGGLSFADLALADGGAGTEVSVTASGEVLVVIEGVTAGQLGAGDFVTVDPSPPEEPGGPPPDPGTGVSVTMDAPVVEGGTARFTIALAQALGEAVTVDFALGAAGDGATAGQDYTVPAVLQAVIPAGLTSVDVDVATLVDQVLEGSEDFTLTLIGVTGGNAVIDPSGASAVFTILDNPPPLVSVSAAAAVTEGTTASFTISLDQLLAVEVTVGFTLGAPGDGATTGQDYTVPAVLQAVIPAGLTSVDVDVATLVDQVLEGSEDFTLTLTGVAGGNAVIDPSGASAVFTILDNPPPLVSVSDAAMVTEGETARFTITLDQPLGSDLTVDFTVGAAGDGATAGQDYTVPAVLQAVIPAGLTSVDVDVATLVDQVLEGSEDFTLTLTGVTGGNAVIDPGASTALGTILGQSPPPGPPPEVLVGTAAAETLTGDGDDNRIDGRAGDDTLDAGAGDDTLQGGPGADQLEGGAGNDIYHHTPGDGHDVISDNAGIDRLIIGNFAPLGPPVAPDQTPVPVTPDPIPGEIVSTSLTVELEAIAQLPPSSDEGRVTRLQELTHAGDGSGRLFVNDVRGKIYVIKDGNLLADPFLDLSAVLGGDLVSSDPAQGLRSIAFHPDFENVGTEGFGKFYTVSTQTVGSAVANPGTPLFEAPALAPAVSHHDVITEWQIDPSNPDMIDPASAREVLRIAQPFSNNNTGQIGFNPNAGPGDPDYGKLYIAVGDGGSNAALGPDPFGQGQDASTVLGTILRIDPLAQGPDSYSVPVDNPFVGDPSLLPEVWAYGLRDPQKFSWDPAGDGKLLVADSGRDATVHIVPDGLDGNSLHSVVPSGRLKAEIVMKNPIHPFVDAGKTYVIEGDFQFAGPINDFTRIIDLEGNLVSGWESGDDNPGIRLTILNGSLVVDRGKIGFTDNFEQPAGSAVPFPYGQRVHIKMELLLGDSGSGRTKVWQDGQLVIDAQGANVVDQQGLARLAESDGGELVLERPGIGNIGVGLTIATGPQELLVDNLLVAVRDPQGGPDLVIINETFDGELEANWAIATTSRGIQEVNLGAAGANFGWGAREGTFVTDPSDAFQLFALPPNDPLNGFTYPIAQYDDNEGREISGGFVYRGSLIPELVGKYVFGDGFQGRLFYIDSETLLDGQQAVIHELSISVNGTLYEVRDLVGKGAVQARNIRFGQGEDGEIYLLTDGDGVVRALRPGDLDVTADPIAAAERSGNDLVITFSAAGSVRVENHFSGGDQALEFLEDALTGQEFYVATGLGSTSDNDLLVGTNANETISGGGGDDRIFGNGGVDLLIGEQGDDRLVGGAGDDILQGGPGNDLLIGEEGDDNLTGGSGADVFFLHDSLAPSDQGDVVTDFEPGIDRLVLPKGLSFADISLEDGGNGSSNLVVASTGVRLARLEAVDPSSLVATDFIAVNPAKPELSVMPAPSVTEGAPASFSIRLDRPAVEDVVVHYQLGTLLDSAVSGSDFVIPGSDTVVVPAGSLGVDLPIPTLVDGLVEGPETLTLTLTRAVGGKSIISDTGYFAIGTILDLDGPPQAFVTDSDPVFEGESARFIIELSKPGAVDIAVSFMLGAAGDSAALGLDFLAPGISSVLVPAGDTSVELDIATVNDSEAEVSESFTLKLTGASEGAFVDSATSSATGTIQDDTPIITGDDGQNVLIGTAAGEIIFGLDAKDTLDGAGGADLLFGGGGDDLLFVDSEDTLIDGGSGDDKVIAIGPGGVTLDLVQSAVEKAIGGPGNDVFDAAAAGYKVRLDGGDGADHLIGGEKADRLRGNAGDDTLIGNAHNDKLFGGSGDDLLFGGDGDDKLDGGSNNDIVDGGAGNDELEGGSGDDTLIGGSGADLISGERGSDVLTGGAGPDLFIYDAATVSKALDKGEIDRITDFAISQSDKIDLSDVLSGTQNLQLVFDSAANPGDTEIHITFDGMSGLLAVVENVDLQTSDFLFL